MDHFEAPWWSHARQHLMQICSGGAAWPGPFTLPSIAALYLYLVAEHMHSPSPLKRTTECSSSSLSLPEACLICTPTCRTSTCCASRVPTSVVTPCRHSSSHFVCTCMRLYSCKVVCNVSDSTCAAALLLGWCHGECQNLLHWLHI